MKTPRTPHLEELAGELRNATPTELLALSDLAAWCAQNQELLRTGRRHGIRIGVTPEVADFISRSFATPAEGQAVAANLVPLER